MKIIDVQDSDDDYDRAFCLARSSFDRLEHLWNTPSKGTRSFMIKVCVEGTHRPIFLWLELIDVSEDTYRGAVFETTDELPDVVDGQVISVAKPLALDWLVKNSAARSMVDLQFSSKGDGSRERNLLNSMTS